LGILPLIIKLSFTYVQKEPGMNVTNKGSDKVYYFLWGLEAATRVVRASFRCARSVPKADATKEWAAPNRVSTGVGTQRRDVATLVFSSLLLLQPEEVAAQRWGDVQ
jgi:hypothetical protein